MSLDVVKMIAEAEAEFAAAETEPEDDPAGFAAFAQMCAPTAEEAAALARKYAEHDRKWRTPFFDKEHPQRDERVVNARASESVLTANPFTWRDPASIPTRQWLYGRHAIRGFVSLTIASGGTGKTALEIGEALAFLSGRDLLGSGLNTSGRVWYVGLEDPLEEYERRVAAAAIHFGFGKADLEGGLFLNSGRDQEFVIARESRDGVLIAEPIIKAIIENVRANDIALVIVDPFIGCHRIGESDNTKVEKVARQWARIAHETNAAVELVHHLRKNGTGAEPSADDARGASALVNAARSVRILSTMSKEEGEAAGVEERRRFFKVASAKANLAIASDDATWRELVSVSLGNGGDGPSDHVAVATDWQWPSPFEGVTPADLRAVQKMIDGSEWRADPRADRWAGKAVADVLGLNLDDRFVNQKTKAMLKTWITNGMLKEVQRKDAQRKPKAFIEVGKWAD